MKFARTIYPHLPYSVRKQISRIRSCVGWCLSAYLAIRLRQRSRRCYEGKHVAIVGLFRTRSGFGRGAELIARSLEMKGVHVTRFDIPGHGMERLDSAAVSPAECDRIGHAISDIVVVANPPIFQQALRMFPLEWLRSRTIVAHWAWELDAVDCNWRNAISLCDEVWASSEFVAQTLKPFCEKRNVPLTVVPYPVDIDPFPPATTSQRVGARRKLRISDDAYTLGYSFALTSNYPRKNPMGAVAAFQKAFPSDETVRLILRALDGEVYPNGMAELKRAAACDRRIIVIEHSSDLPIVDFYAAIDLYVSPARAEGYGLNIVEATQAGRPVVAVAWSLSKDVLGRPGVTTTRYRLVPVVDRQGIYVPTKQALWADPDIEDLANKIIIARDRLQGRGPSRLKSGDAEVEA